MLPYDPMRAYRHKRDTAHQAFNTKYAMLGFISSGTYGRVYKAKTRDAEERIYAIKKFKPDKEGEVVTYTGISQSAIREIALNREISHENIVALREVVLEDKSIYMVFEYAEHDFLQIIHHFSTTVRAMVPPSLLKSCIHQLLNGLVYLHTCHIQHRDLKPANILINSDGVVKIGDLGLARLTYSPLQPLYSGDKVVVTIWYRAPELLLGARHYTKAIDCWAVGCVMAELISLRPIFKGEEAKLDHKKNVPFQKDQVVKIFEVLGTPSVHEWPGLPQFPEYLNMKALDNYPPKLTEWCTTRFRSKDATDLLRQLFMYNPENRATAPEAFNHKWFSEDIKPTRNAFHGLPPNHCPPLRKITQDEASLAHHVPASNNNNPAYNNPNSKPASWKPASGQNFGSAFGVNTAVTMQVPAGNNSGGSRKKPRLE
ncbi:CMGC/CDK/CDK8 protein kinase [Sistotremastrum niveocremeum HHB9708]|uniref:Cyclin-dependent kinase 8 n=1 Tax=Sistotremastrum niveocremeum HHB9708 TaxID=1314777 RepID=A0A164SD63_9AGAM|nr:CMGC/CDK/CDK8 protein kinase [Sistotremastrum niveocremeum HHB9708]